jgi:hypothetical protein
VSGLGRYSEAVSSFQQALVSLSPSFSLSLSLSLSVCVCVYKHTHARTHTHTHTHTHVVQKLEGEKGQHFSSLMGGLEEAHRLLADKEAAADNPQVTTTATLLHL